MAKAGAGGEFFPEGAWALAELRGVDLADEGLGFAEHSVGAQGFAKETEALRGVAGGYAVF